MPFTPVIAVEVRDAADNPVTSAALEVTLSLGDHPHGAVATLTHSATAGVATFGDLVLERSGGYTLRAQAAGLEPVTSAPGNVRPGPADGERSSLAVDRDGAWQWP